MQTVFIKSLRIFAYHGLMPQENKVGSNFMIDVELATDFSRAIIADEIEGTVSYADLLEVIKREMAVPSKLLEHVAGRIVNAIFETFPQVSKIDFRITKENPPMGADCAGAGIRIHTTRSDFFCMRICNN